MNKLFTKIATAFVGIAMAIGVGVAVGSKESVKHAEAVGKSDWEQITSLDDIKSGSKYLIVSSSDAYYLNGSTSSSHFSGTSLSASNPASDSAAGVLLFTAIAGKTNTYSMQLVSTNKYIGATAAKSGSATVTLSSDSDGWTITGSSGDFNAQFQASGKQAYLRTYTTNTQFRTYANTNNGTVIHIYGKAKSLSGISVKTAPTKTSYVSGECFDPTGLVITRTYSDSTTSDYAYAGHTTEFTFSPTTSTALTSSNTSVTITYGGKSTSQTITVTAPKTPASLATTGQTTSFEAGDTFAYGGTSTVTYTDSTSKTVTPSSFKIGNAGINPISAGTVIVPGTTVLNRNDHHGKTVYVLYEENSTTVYASYTISVAAITKISFVGGTDTGSASGQGQSDTLTKSGISMSCDSCYTTSGAYRFYSGSTLTISSTVGNIAKIEFNMNGSYSSSLLSTSTGTYNDDDSSKGVWTGEATSIAFDLSAQARCDSVDITLASNDPLVELAPGSSAEVSMLKGDEYTSVKVLVKNIETKTWSFTFDEDEQEGITTSSYISVSAGDAVSDVHTLTITTKATGSTTMHISVSGTACTTAVPVTVNAKPASIAIKSGNTLELQNGGPSSKSSRGYTKASLTIKDTDGNDYSISSITDDVTLTNISGDDCVTISGGTITAKSVGECTVRFSLNILPSVYTDLSVSVIDDYNISVNSVIFNSDLMDDQGKSIAHTNIFDTREANTHFGVVADILDSEIKYSYNPNDAANAVSATAFYYDFDHGTTDPEFGEGYKDQIIYVYFSFDNWESVSYTTTFSVVIAQSNIDLESISLDTGSSLSLQRNTSHQLVVSYSPDDTTSTREVSYEIVSSSEGSTIEVSSGGLITAGDRPGSSARIKVTSLFSSSINATVDVEVTLESMTYTVDEPETWSKANSISVGDEIIIVNEDAKRELTEVNASNVGEATTYSSSPAHSFPLIVGEGNAEDTFTLSNNGNYLAYTNSSTSKNNNIYILSNPSGNDQLNQISWTIEITDGDATITNVYNANRDLQYNSASGQERFCCYTSVQTAVQIYKKNGGETPHTVTEALFNAVHDNFGDSDTTYTWSDTCPSFDLSSWTTAGNAVKGITDFSSYKLNLAVGNIEGNEIEVFIAKYDIVVAKFYKDCKTDQEKAALDFLGRVTSGKVTPVKRVMILGDNAFNSNTSIIVVIVSLVSATSVGGYFFLRKKKED